MGLTPFTYVPVPPCNTQDNTPPGKKLERSAHHAFENMVDTPLRTRRTELAPSLSLNQSEQA